MCEKKHRICDTCGCEFKRHHKPGKNGSFCTRECREAAKLRNCEHCGGSFHCLDSQKKTCSERCRQEQAASKRRKCLISRQCKVCGKEFQRSQGRINSKPCVYCSRKCRDSRVHLVSWMRGKQQDYKRIIGRLNPNNHQVNKTTWEGWCFYTAKQEHGVKESSLEQRWKSKLASICSCNRGRFSVRIANDQKARKQTTWTVVLKRLSISPKLKTNYFHWMKKLHGKCRSQAQRIRRKAWRSQQRD